MSSFIYHTLMMLEDVGMSVRYPEIRHVTFDDDGGSTLNIEACCLLGTRVNIEQNQSMKFMMMFTVLDFFIDTTAPELEGKSFAQKYRCLPSDNDYDLMLRELFRVAKVMRNSLVHNPSSFKFTNESLDISYKFKNTDFGIRISASALGYFYTALVMFTKGDLGKGCYFLGIMRSIYKNILSGISYFSDEFNSPIEEPSNGLEIKPYVREVLVRPEYELEGDYIKFLSERRHGSEWQGVDMFIEVNGKDILVPAEALDEDFTIDKTELLESWEHESSFPALNKNL